MKKTILILLALITMILFAGCAGIKVVLDNDDPDRKALKGEAQELHKQWFRDMNR